MESLIQYNLVYIFGGIFVLIVVLLVLLVIVLFQVKQIKKRSELFFKGKKGEDLEKLILTQVKDIEKNKKDIKELFDGYEKIYKIASKGIQKVGVVRYNPFGDMGGKQSFVIALLDGDDSGIIISSLQSREGLHLFVKTIINKQCLDYPLTDEEKDAVKNAKVTKGEKRV